MFLDAVATHLATENVVDGGTGWPLFESFVPSTPDKVVVLTPTGGLEPDNQGDSQLVGVVTFQSFTRGGKLKEEENAYTDAMNKAIEIFTNTNKAQIAGFTHLFALQSRPIFIGYDENRRPQFTMNFSGRYNL